MIRVIIQSSENGEQEYVRFDTDNLDEDSDFFKMSGCTIDHDFNIDCRVFENSGFPFNYDLKRQ